MHDTTSTPDSKPNVDLAESAKWLPHSNHRPNHNSPMDDPDPPSPSACASQPVMAQPPQDSSMIPKLGDFSRLRLDSGSSPATNSPRHHASTSPSSSKTLRHHSPHALHTNDNDGKAASLGNFARIFGAFGAAGLAKQPSVSSTATTAAPPVEPSPTVLDSTEEVQVVAAKQNISIQILSPDREKSCESKRADKVSPTAAGAGAGAGAVSESESASDADSYTTPATSLSTSPNGKFIVLKDLKSRAIQRKQYVPWHNGLTREQTHQVVLEKLKSHHMLDHLTSKACPATVVNGIHVFLDTSNIYISFLNALKDKLGMDRNDRLTPAPALNVEFLTKILVRDRLVNVKNAGCSFRPDRPEPPVVEQLRKLGYSVDVRERKRLEEPCSPPRDRGASQRNKNTHSIPPPSSDRVHYAEDLVDETLQTRIGEAVMKHFQTPGTLVLATGDGKAAKFSDGFFTYADRALKMGWNVEVVSWNLSLSFAWRDASWAGAWGHRFRIIQLDDFLLELCAS
jgi:hypothetical protein